MQQSGTVLVTGASGFIGRNLVAAMVAAGRSVRAAGHDAPYADAGIDWRSALTDVQSVVHLAGRHVGDAEVFDRDVAMTLNLGRQAADLGIARFVYLSSIKVNGDNTSPGRAFSEADPPDPQDNYGRAKLRMEQGLAALSLPLTVIRPPLVYGPNGRGNFRSLVRAVERGWPLPLAAVANRRSLLGVGNLAHFVQHVLDEPAAIGETYVVSDGHDVSTPALLHAVAQTLGRPCRLFSMPPQLLESGLRVAGLGHAADRLLGDLRVDIGKARQLGWNPPLSLEQGLAALRAPSR